MRLPLPAPFGVDCGSHTRGGDNQLYVRQPPNVQKKAISALDVLGARVSRRCRDPSRGKDRTARFIRCRRVRLTSGLSGRRPGYAFYTVESEFDPDKSRSNKDKHGIDFQAAQALWDDPDLLEIPARTSDKPRFVVVARIGDKHWSGVIIYREHRVRIISVRRSRSEEVDLYESS